MRNNDNLLPKGRPLIMRLQQLLFDDRKLLMRMTVPALTSPGSPRPCLERKDEDGGTQLVGLSCFRRLGTHLFHELAHFREVARRALFDPDFIALRSLFHIAEELLVGPLFPSSSDHRHYSFPDSKEFATRREE